MTHDDDMVLVRRGDLTDLIDEAETWGAPIPDSLPIVLAARGPAVESAHDRSSVEHVPATRTLVAVGEAGERWWEAFWRDYPRKVGKRAARKAWDKAMKEGVDPMDIVDGAARFKAHWSDQPGHRLGFIPYPATWLNAGSWEDELVPHASEVTKTQQNRQSLMAAARAIDEGKALTFTERMKLAGDQQAIGGGR